MNILYDFIKYLPSRPWYTQEGCGVSESPFMAYTILFTTIVYALEAYLDLRQRGKYKVEEFPKPLCDAIGKIDTATPKQEETEDKTEGCGETDGSKLLLPKLKKKFSAAQSYGLDKIEFGIIHSFYSLNESLFFLITGFLPYMWDFAVRIGSDGLPFGWKVDGEIQVTLIFLFCVQVLGMITELPFDMYSTFSIEKKHGFNKQTWGLFFVDKVKSMILTFVIGGPFVSLLLWIIKKGGDKFYLYVWAFMFIFSLFMMTIVPVVIMPLFNKYEPLPDGELKNQIYALADKLEYPLQKLFIVDGSKRSSHSNAYMFGFGKNKRIVLYDTLMEQVHDNEILAILGHELGHWKLGHTMVNFIVTQVYTGAAFYCFSLCYNSVTLYEAFGFESTKVPAMIALLLFFQTIWAPVDKILSFILTINSRSNEFAADKFSSDQGMSKELQSGLCKIHLENLGAMCPDFLYSTYHYSHPPLVERLSALMTQDKKMS
uniref:CAAX prenyl protease n=1 Tax=Corethron hystrix TaxID=216773 RepID=A0A7S1BXV1_9STRA|mmetsp:Transcript_6166/g.13322  ORF Transcript_6166/g.13322 Transcript_6166/m.13322 type:complete len:486 (+) Transcript_6166:194-1651(+)|eukprot:CAMPEP_0113306458 /NCGR_PEP_ID=MMETSP0010_2-20120614/5700_1 /TAXON_ID=216773 ORGANISM="Corethron hystrix, Strain 308" /NCGR_SAMPLE_ID=MMETSP0010_2 /ASSEMBLY_ACC=CAM_ASM_000155 /LENGTH=485 /DNA_ID=CAMNT_0000161127 /DNA_START=366 /DNA_END=1823 /DNA_ORIENTATION=- /assembly_acc=CAM_ASM_000155